MKRNKPHNRGTLYSWTIAKNYMNNLRVAFFFSFPGRFNTNLHPQDLWIKYTICNVCYLVSGRKKQQQKNKQKNKSLHNL